MMKNSKLKFSEYMQNISRSKSFGKFVIIVQQKFVPTFEKYSFSEKIASHCMLVRNKCKELVIKVFYNHYLKHFLNSHKVFKDSNSYLYGSWAGMIKVLSRHILNIINNGYY